MYQKITHIESSWGMQSSVSSIVAIMSEYISPSKFMHSDKQEVVVMICMFTKSWNNCIPN